MSASGGKADIGDRMKNCAEISSGNWCRCVGQARPVLNDCITVVFNDCITGPL
jgi:hypothetical protein